MPLTKLTARSPFLLACLVLAPALFDFLFWNHFAGFTRGLFVLALLLFMILRRPSALRRRAPRLVAVAIVGLAAAFCVGAVALPLVLSIVALPLYSILSRSPWTTSIFLWLHRGLTWIIHWITRPLADQTIHARWLWRHPSAGGVPVMAAWRWSIPAAAGLVFVALFTLANPVVEFWLRQTANVIRQLLIDWRELFYPPRMACWLAVCWTLWALLRPPKQRGRALSNRPPRLANWCFGPGLIIRCLIVFNFIFGVQTVLDLYYLWGAAALPDGLTYAHYAHRGAYPLIATALLAAAFVLLTFRQGSRTQESAAARRLVYLWIAQNILLVISTIWRVKRYVDVYSLSRWRVSTMVWMLLVALGLLWIILRIAWRRDNVWLLRCNIVTAAGVLYVCCFVPFDRGIAWFNVGHCHEIRGAGVDLDIAYLSELGEESIPALGWAADHMEQPREREVRYAADQLNTDLQSQMSDWRAWTWRRAELLGR